MYPRIVLSMSFKSWLWIRSEGYIVSIGWINQRGRILYPSSEYFINKDHSLGPKLTQLFTKEDNAGISRRFRKFDLPRRQLISSSSCGQSARPSHTAVGGMQLPSLQMKLPSWHSWPELPVSPLSAAKWSDTRLSKLRLSNKKFVN